MFKSLIRTIPLFTGNATLACKITDTNIDNDNVVIGDCREAELKPLQSNLYNRYVSVNLLNSSYEFDISKYYNKYHDVFYKSNINFDKNDFMLYHENEENYDRNIDYEFGCKRISYNANNYMYEFFAPLYIDNINDIPDYFDINIKFNDHFAKKLRIEIGVKSNKNFLYHYINRYVSQLDNLSIFYNENIKSFIYHAIDVKNGGFVSIQDNTINYMIDTQTTINLFDKNLAKGFLNNSLVMKQIIPISFMFNINDMLNKIEQKHYNFIRIQKISGNYIKDEKICNLNDFDFDYDNYVCYSGSMSNAKFIPETHLDIYKYENKITPIYGKWRLQVSDDKIYNTNLNIKYSQYNSTYFDYYNSMHIYNETIPVELGNINIKNLSSKYEGFDIIDDKMLNDVSSLFDKSNWKKTINNYAFVNNFLWNLNNIYKDVNIDYFNIFIIPSIMIMNESNYGETIFARNVYEQTEFYNNVYLNISSYVKNDCNTISLLTKENRNNNFRHRNNIYLKKIDNFNKDKKQYFKIEIQNKYFLLDDVEKLIKRFNKEYENIISGYLMIENFNYPKNIANIYNSIYDKLYFINEYVSSITPVEDYIDDILLMSTKSKFYVKLEFVDYYELYNLLYDNPTDNSHKSEFESLVRNFTVYENELIDNQENIFVRHSKKHVPIYVDQIQSNLIYRPKDLNNYIRIDNHDMFTLYDNIYDVKKSNWIMSTLSINTLPNTTNLKIDDTLIKIQDTIISDISNIYPNESFSLFKYNEEDEYSYRLYKHILAKPITISEITKLMEYDETYYMYIPEKENELHIGNIEYKVTNEENHIQKLERLYNNIKRVKDEISLQKELINGGKICFYNSTNNEYVNITNYDNVSFLDDNIVYVDDVSYKYPNMIEANNETLSSIIIDKLINEMKNTDSRVSRFNKLLNILLSGEQSFVFRDISIYQRDTKEKYYVYSSKQHGYEIDILKLVKYLKSLINKLNELNYFKYKLNYEKLTNFMYNKIDEMDIRTYRCRKTVDIQEHLRKIQEKLYDNIFENELNENIKILYDICDYENNQNPTVEQYYVLIDSLYENYIYLYNNLIKRYNIQLYEYYKSNYSEILNDIDIDKYKIHSYKQNIDDSPIRIFEYNGNTYGAIFISQLYTNTDFTFNLGTHYIFNTINNVPVISSLNSEIINTLMPYFKQNIFFNLLTILKNDYNVNLCQYPKKYKIDIKYEYDKANVKTDEYYDSELQHELYNSSNSYKHNDSKIYKLQELETNKTAYLYRYLNYMIPIFKTINNNINIYRYKYKYSPNVFYGNDNIYDSTINLYNYDGIKCFTDMNNSKIKDSKFNTEYNIEYKHFNDNSYINIVPQFEILIDKELTHEELLEYENKEIIFKYFLNYIKKYSLNKTTEEKTILFLFNKYKISCESNPIHLNFFKTYKLYKLKYKFTLL